MYLIAGDIGGTKSWLALLEDNGSGNYLFDHRYRSDNFPDATALLRQFIADAPDLDAPIGMAALALPGPVSSGRSRLTNLDWTVDRQQLASDLAIPAIHLLNDFQASAAGIATLSQDELLVLNPAEAQANGLRVVTGAGTGLGLAWMSWQDGAYHTNATEGGHIDFAPGDEPQLELLRYLHQVHGRRYVSYEQLLSGKGLETLYQFIDSTGGKPHHVAGERVSAAMVSALAMDNDENALQAVEMFIAIYGAWVGNLALLYRPTGGLYIAGGIAAKMVSWMRSERFSSACFNKGAMTDLVRQTPIYLVTNERLGLQGAAAIAIRLSQQ